MWTSTSSAQSSQTRRDATARRSSSSPRVCTTSLKRWRRGRRRTRPSSNSSSRGHASLSSPLRRAVARAAAAAVLLPSSPPPFPWPRLPHGLTPPVPSHPHRSLARHPWHRTHHHNTAPRRPRRTHAASSSNFYRIASHLHPSPPSTFDYSRPRATANLIDHGHIARTDTPRPRPHPGSSGIEFEFRAGQEWTGTARGRREAGGGRREAHRGEKARTRENARTLREGRGRWDASGAPRGSRAHARGPPPLVSRPRAPQPGRARQPACRRRLSCSPSAAGAGPE